MGNAAENDCRMCSRESIAQRLYKFPPRAQCPLEARPPSHPHGPAPSSRRTRSRPALSFPALARSPSHARRGAPPLHPALVPHVAVLQARLRRDAGPRPSLVAAARKTHPPPRLRCGDGKADRYGLRMARLTVMARTPRLLTRKEIHELVFCCQRLTNPTQGRRKPCHSGQPCQKGAIAVSLARLRRRLCRQKERAAGMRIPCEGGSCSQPEDDLPIGSFAHRRGL